MKEALEHPERVINMDAMNFGEHIGDIEGNNIDSDDILIHISIKQDFKNHFLNYPQFRARTRIRSSVSR